jgi:hypothetical protein
MPLYEIKEPIKDYVGADTFDDAIYKYIKENIKNHYDVIKITDHLVECIYAIKYNSKFTKFKFNLIQHITIPHIQQPFNVDQLFNYGHIEKKKYKPNNYIEEKPTIVKHFSPPTALSNQAPYQAPYQAPSNSFNNSIFYSYNYSVDPSKETPHLLTINNKNYPVVVLNKAIYPVSTAIVKQNDVIINNNFNENKWDNDIKKQFLDQYDFFENFFPSLKNWRKDNIFVDSNTPMSSEFNKYYTETLVKDISSGLKSRVMKNNKMNIFSVSLFTGKIPSFVDRNIVYNKQLINYDDYINKHSNWTDQQHNAKNIGHVKPDAPWHKDILTYFEILFSNIKLHQSKYPDWVVRLYTDDSIINSSSDKLKDIYQELLNFDIQIIKTEFKQPYEGKIATMLTRFLPMFDKTVSKYLSIEADNWPTEIYWKVLDQWIKNNANSLAYVSGYTYGWPSGIKTDINISTGDFASLIHFRQNYGGMFGLSKPNNKIYNPKLLDVLMIFAEERKEYFNKLFVDNKFILNQDQYDTNYTGVISTPISENSLFDKGIDEVWLSLFVLPKLDTVFSVPIYGDMLNFSALSHNDKIIMLNKYNMKEDIADLDDSAFKSLALFSNKKNKTIFYSIEMILMEYLLEIRPNDTTIDFNKYRDKFVPTFINLYPDFQAAKNYKELSTIKSELDTDTLDFTDSYLLEKQKYLKYKNKYLALRAKYLNIFDESKKNIPLK